MSSVPAAHVSAALPSRRSLIVRLAVGVVLINLIVAGMVLLSLDQSRNQYEANARTTSHNLSLALAESVAGDIDKIDLALQTAVDEIERQIAAGGVDSPTLNRYLERLQNRVSETISMRVMDAHGIVTYGRGVDPRLRQDNSDREYFTRHRDNPQAGLVITKPVFARIDKKWVVPISRQIRLPDGSFGGAVYVNVALDHLTTMFSNIDVGRNGSVSLRDAEQRTFARFPLPKDMESVLGEEIDVPPLRELIEAGRAEGSYVTSRTVDGIERNFTARAIPGRGLYIVIGKATGEYMAPWRHQAMSMLGFTLLFLAITIVSSGIVFHTWKRRNAAIDALVEERASLRQAYAYNRSLIEASLDPLVTIGPDGKITDVNSAAETVTGCARDALIGTDFSEYFSAPDKASAVYRQVFREGLVRDYELEIRHRDGHLTPVLYNATVYRNGGGKIVGAFAAARDISERKRVDEELRKSEARFREALEHAPIGMAIALPDGRFVEVNRALCQVVGYTAEELLSLGFGQITYPDDLQNDLSHLKLLEAGAINFYEIEKRFIRKDGGIVQTQLTASMIRDAQGRPLQVIKQIQDITERKRVEEEIRNLNQQLEQRVKGRTALLEAANRELEELSYSMSHDMRTPLRAIDGFSQLLLDEYSAKLDEEGRRLLEVVRGNARRMGSQIDDVVRFLNLRKRQLQCAPVDIAALARDAFQDLRAACPSRRMRMVVNELPPAWGDHDMLRQVLLNLLSNAIKFTPAQDEAVIELDGRAEAAANSYTVKDRGVGFDMRYAGKLFKMFERVHPTGQYEGTAIGLAMVKRIVERHGGRVWAEGEVGQGASFHFSLPNRDSAHDGIPRIREVQ